MKLDGLDHPKTLDLSARLDISLPQTIGHLELLWAFVAQKTPRGNIGKWPDGTIARAAHWTDDPTVFVTALADAGFLDTCDENRYVVHDWPEHCPRWVTSKLSRNGDSFAYPECSTDYSAEYSADSSEHPCARGPSQAKPSQAKSRSEDKSSSLAPDGAEAKSAKQPRKRDEIWEAVLAACGLDGQSPTKSERGAWNKAVSELRSAGATPEQIHARAKAYRRKWPTVSLTPTALSRRWNECVATTPTGQRSETTLEAFD